MNETQIKKSSIKSIKSTILCDYQTYRWFTFLILQPQAKNTILNQPGTIDRYKRLSTILFFQKAFYLISFFYLLALFYVKNYSILFFGLSLALITYAIYIAKKNLVAEISVGLLKNNFQEEVLTMKTLYQIGEHFSRLYNIPSLVDAMYSTDTILRKALKFLIVFVIFIYPYNLLKNFIGIIGIFLAINFIINTDSIYKKF